MKYIKKDTIMLHCAYFREHEAMNEICHHVKIRLILIMDFVFVILILVRLF